VGVSFTMSPERLTVEKLLVVSVEPLLLKVSVPFSNVMAAKPMTGRPLNVVVASVPMVGGVVTRFTVCDVPPTSW